MEVIFHLYSNLGDMLSFSPASFFKQVLPWNSKNRRKFSKPPAEAAATMSHVARLQEIPEEITEFILQGRLSVSDLIRLSAVSRYCRSVAMQKSIQPAQQIPWLVLPQEPDCKRYLRVVELLPPQHQDGLLKLKLPKQLLGALVCGSCKGWLVLAKAVMPSLSEFLGSWLLGFQVDIQLFLFNPISGTTFQLPPKRLFYPPLSCYPLLNTLTRNILEFPPKFALSSSDPSNCFVASLGLHGFGRVTLCRPGDKEWSIFSRDGKDVPDDIDDVCCLDILFYKGILFVFTYEGLEVVEDYTFKLQTGQVVRLKLIPNFTFRQPEPRDINFPFADGGFGIGRELVTQIHLVESTSGELLLIARICDILTIDGLYENVEDPHFDYRITTGFKVYKLSPDTGRINRLRNLGDQVVFLADAGSQSLSTRDLKGVRGNCIFFMEDWPYLYEKFVPLVSRESGVYYLDNERIERCFPSVKPPMKSRMCWYIPTLL